MSFVERSIVLCLNLGVGGGGWRFYCIITDICRTSTYWAYRAEIVWLSLRACGNKDRINFVCTFTGGKISESTVQQLVEEHALAVDDKSTFSEPILIFVQTMRQVTKQLSFAGLLPQVYFTLIGEKVMHGHLQQQEKLSVSHEILQYSWYCLDVIVLW